MLAGLPKSPTNMGRRLVWVLGLLLSVVASHAQTVVPGVISGHVRGPGGVSFPGATVQAIDLQTGEHKVTWSDEAGNYTLTGLHPGNYKLEISLVGFRADSREPVPVTDGQPIKVNVALVLALPESSGPLNARDAARSGGPANLQSLPEDVRARLSGLGDQGGLQAEGAAAGAASEGDVRFSGDSGNGSSPQNDSSMAEGELSQADASASAANSFLLSGSLGQSATPGDEEGRMRDKIEEFRRARETEGGGGFGPGMGGEGGGPVMIFLGRGGGGPGGGGGGGGRGDWTRRRAQIDRLRGSISAQYANSALNARLYPLNGSSPQIPSHRVETGITVGGPLVIPKVYNGRDKTSFFVNYNLNRSRNPFDSFATVPTPAERAGDFSQAVVPAGPFAGTVPTIYDPASNPRTPFLGNQIPPPRFDAAAQGLLQFIPLPNLPGSVQNFHLREALPSSSDRVMGRVGHRISQKDNVNAFYFFNSSHSDSVSTFPALTRSSSSRSQSLNVGETHTFSPHIINNLMLNFTRQRTSTLNPFAFQQNISSALGIQGVSQDPRDWGLPLISFTNFAGLNDLIPSLTRNQTLRASNFLIWNRGKHNVRLGGELRRVQLNTLSDPDARGTFTFTGFTTSNFSSQGLPQPGTGLDFADFLLGLPQSTSVRFGIASNYLSSWVYSAFAQDDWRLSSRWTLNFGLRYEYFQPFTEKYGHLSDLAIGPNFSSISVVTGQSPGSLPSSLIRGQAKNLSPRVGVAFRPWKQHKVVLRAGYGLFYDASIYQRLVPNLVNQPPFAQASILLTDPNRVLTLEQGFPQIAPGVARNTYAVDPNFKTPYGQTWNFSMEDEIVRNVLLSVGYVGTKGTALDLLLGPNRSTAGQLGLQSALQFTYETSGASSIYHGLQVGLRRQFHGGFSMGGNYTFSKAIDDASGVGGAGHVVAQSLDLRAERGLSVFDVRHKLSIYHTYELPFGERHRYLNHGSPLAKVLGDWQISGNAQLQSGTPLTARVLGNQGASAGQGAYFAGRAEATGLPVSLPGFEQTTLRYFNTAAFTLPPTGELGNAGRNTIPGPRTVDFNMSLGRFVTISQEKGVRANFRVEANNVFNTPSFGGLGTTVDAAEFGRVTSVKPMRTLSFSMRLSF